MKIELKIHGDDGRIHEAVIENASFQVERGIVEIPPVNGYRCYESLPTAEVTIQGELTNANSLTEERGV